MQHYYATVIGHPNALRTWISTAMRLTDTHGGDWYNGLRIIAFGESDDNQLVVPGQSGYLCDSNCVAGTPSMGVVQEIRATFVMYHQAGTGWNMLNPTAEIASSINYIKDKYGSIDNVPGVASVRAGGAYHGY